MTELSYDDAPVTVRSDLLEAHRNAWRHISGPGTWFTGAERIAIAIEARNARACKLCIARKAAISPYAVDGQHDAVDGTSLSAASVDVIHRVVTDPGRLSKRWFDETMASGLSDAEYIEIIGVVVCTVTVDLFCRALGVPPHELCEPRAGEPTKHRPPDVSDDGAWVPLGKRTGINIARSLSLVPAEMRTMSNFMGVHYARFSEIRNPSYERAITRPQMELVAARVSALAGCFY